MTVFVCSKGKSGMLKTVEWMSQSGFTDYIVVISHDDNLAEYKKNGYCVKAPESCDQLSKKKEWITNKFAKKNQWVFIIDDNVMKVTGIKKVKITPTKKDFDQLLTIQDVLAIARKDIINAGHTSLIGYASNSNHFFRATHYRMVGFVWGKMCLFRNDGIPWNHSCREMDDYIITAETLKIYGRVWINNWVYATHKKYEGGGSPPYEKRVPGKKIAAKYLVEKYGDLFRYADRPNCVPKTEVRMRFHSRAQIQKWRMTQKQTGYVTT